MKSGQVFSTDALGALRLNNTGEFWHWKGLAWRTVSLKVHFLNKPVLRKQCKQNSDFLRAGSARVTLSCFAFASAYLLFRLSWLCVRYMCAHRTAPSASLGRACSVWITTPLDSVCVSEERTPFGPHSYPPAAFSNHCLSTSYSSLQISSQSVQVLVHEG